MFYMWIITCFFVLPAGLGRVLDDTGERDERSTGGQSQEQSDSNYIYKPSLRIRSDVPEKIKMKTGENNVLECEAGGNPPPTIHWLKDGKRIPQSVFEVLHPETNNEEGAVPILGLSFTRSRLFLDCVTTRDAGEYSCVAENCALGSCTTKSKTTWVHIKTLENTASASICLSKKTYGSPARIHMWTHTRLEIQGSDVQLFCRPEGEPRPEIMWLGPNNTPLDDPQKYEILSSGDLIIHNINWDDMGGYACAVKNSEGYDEITTFLYPTLADNGKTTDG